MVSVNNIPKFLITNSGSPTIRRRVRMEACLEFEKLVVQYLSRGLLLITKHFKFASFNIM